MSRVFNFALISFLLALVFSGCESADPTPDQTVVGNPTRPINGEVPMEYTGIGGSTGTGYSATDDGIGGPRDSSFNDMNGPGFGDGGSGSQNVLHSVYFGFDQSSIPPAERSKVEAAAQYLRDNPGSSLIAEGHTDAIGTSEYNNALSDRRANSVKTYLEQLGIPGDRVEVLAMGELNADQSATKGSPASAEDRRVDLIGN